MLLVIDVGNTETLIGLYALGDVEVRQPGAEAGKPPTSRFVNRSGAPPAGFGIGAVADGSLPGRGLTHHWRLSTVVGRTPDEHAVLLAQLLDLEGLDIGSSLTGIAISSSVPRVTAELRLMANRWFGSVPCVVLGPGVKSGMPVLYENPKEVGADRVANAIGAFDLYGGPCVVVDLGTATTLDAVSEKGEYLGGAIAPGVAISMEALFEHAAGLRRVELVAPHGVIGRSTAESLESGVFFGYAAQVDGLCARFIEELGTAEVVATGGLCELIAPYARSFQHVEPWLTLHGLRIVYDRHVEERKA